MTDILDVHGVLLAGKQLAEILHGFWRALYEHDVRSSRDACIILDAQWPWCKLHAASDHIKRMHSFQHFYEVPSLFKNAPGS